MAFERPDDNRLSAVRAGMRAVDARGHEIGKVDSVHLGDPEAATDQGQPAVDPEGLLDRLFSPGDRGLPDQVRARLARTGFVRIDKSGILSGTAYAAADQVARVEADTVHLTENEDALLTA